jgi:YtkA-like
MQRVIMSAVLGVVLLTVLPVALVWGADLKVVQTQKAKDMTITLLSESGQWTQGKNTFVLEFTSAATKQPIDVGKVTLNTSMPMPGMAPMLAGATLSPDKAPGRYLGTISFPDRGHGKSPSPGTARPARVRPSSRSLSVKYSVVSD